MINTRFSEQKRTSGNFDIEVCEPFPLYIIETLRTISFKLILQVCSKGNWVGGY